MHRAVAAPRRAAPSRRAATAWRSGRACAPREAWPRRPHRTSNCCNRRARRRVCLAPSASSRAATARAAARPSSAESSADPARATAALPSNPASHGTLFSHISSEAASDGAGAQSSLRARRAAVGFPGGEAQRSALDGLAAELRAADHAAAAAYALWWLLRAAAESGRPAPTLARRARDKAGSATECGTANNGSGNGQSRRCATARVGAVDHAAASRLCRQHRAAALGAAGAVDVDAKAARPDRILTPTTSGRRRMTAMCDLQCTPAPRHWRPA